MANERYWGTASSPKLITFPTYECPKYFLRNLCARRQLFVPVIVGQLHAVVCRSVHQESFLSVDAGSEGHGSRAEK
jgi:hypothetical protein